MTLIIVLVFANPVSFIEKNIVLFSLQSIIRKESKYVCYYAQKGDVIHTLTAIPTNFPLKSKGMAKKKTD